MTKRLLFDRYRIHVVSVFRLNKKKKNVWKKGVTGRRPSRTDLWPKVTNKSTFPRAKTIQLVASQTKPITTHYFIDLSLESKPMAQKRFYFYFVLFDLWGYKYSPEVCPDISVFCNSVGVINTLFMRAQHYDMRSRCRHIRFDKIVNEQS